MVPMAPSGLVSGGWLVCILLDYFFFGDIALLRGGLVPLRVALSTILPECRDFPIQQQQQFRPDHTESDKSPTGQGHTHRNL